MLDNLTTRLARVMKTLKGEARLTESNIADALREVRMALLEADVALPVVKDFIAAVKEKAVGQEVIGSLNPGQALIGVVHGELTKIMGDAHEGINFNTQPPAIVLMAGLQGAGKTTTVGKLGKFLKENHKKKVLVVSCDVYRPAAIEQLKSVAGQAGVDFFPSSTGEKPEAIALAAIDWAKRHYHDVLLVDTAGRLAVDEAMMAEIKRLHAAINPVETLFVVDAMLGQDAVNTAKAFNEALPLTGVVLTKLDGDARGGAALSVRHITGKPIKFAGVGEKLAGLEAFHPERMASRILGMGDILTFAEKAQEQVDEKQARELARKLRRNEFTLEDFRDQLLRLRKMGSMEDLLGMIPGLGGKMKEMKGMAPDETQLKKTVAIIDSMTAQERRNAKLLNGSRRKRIAAGSGTTVQDVNRLMKNFQAAEEMIKRMTKGGKKGRGAGMGRNLPFFR